MKKVCAARLVSVMAFWEILLSPLLQLLAL
jgi:hypothetical protein